MWDYILACVDFVWSVLLLVVKLGSGVGSRSESRERDGMHYICAFGKLNILRRLLKPDIGRGSSHRLFMSPSE